MPNPNKKPDKQTAILEATLELIGKNGFHGAPTSKIAEKAGVGVGSIYRYFKDKDDLIHEIFLYCEDKMSKETLRDHDPDAPIREQFLRLCANMFHYLVEHHNIFFFMEQYFNSPYGISSRREILVFEENTTAAKPEIPLFDLLEKAKAQQIVKDLPFAVLGAITFGPILILVRDVCAGLFHLDESMVQKIVEACWDGVKR